MRLLVRSVDRREPLGRGRAASLVASRPVAIATRERGLDLRNLPQAKAPEQNEKKSRFATKMLARPSDPAGATDRLTAPGDDQTVDVVSSYRVTRNLDVTAGVRYKSDDGVQPLTDARRDSQAVYVGTAFRF